MCWSNSELSKGIRCVTKSIYSHACVVSDVNEISEAQAYGVFPKTFDNWQAKYKYNYKVFTPPYKIDKDEFRSKCQQYYGDNYDFGLFSRLGLKYIFKKRLNLEKFKTNKREICFEFVALVNGFPNPQTFTGETLEKYLLDNGWTIQYNY